MSWKEEWEDCCGKCRYHRKEQGYRDWVCTCERSDAYGCETTYSDDACECYENRKTGEGKSKENL